MVWFLVFWVVVFWGFLRLTPWALVFVFLLCVWNGEPVVVEPHGGSVSWCQSSTSWIIPDILNVFGTAAPEQSQTPPGRAWLHPIGVTHSHEIVWDAMCSLQWGLIHGERGSSPSTAVLRAVHLQPQSGVWNLGV